MRNAFVGCWCWWMVLGQGKAPELVWLAIVCAVVLAVQALGTVQVRVVGALLARRPHGWLAAGALGWTYGTLHAALMAPALGCVAFIIIDLPSAATARLGTVWPQYDAVPALPF
eukprot:TRINITY_DN27034_c0_g1_i1.p5 TRINITY_DN27034_c0_g1~~TRINITY_DN27034_c0_g1_i1.p5  ORF type:complete len:114 (+),score=36.62 TRINITY_DN27034_c0_g1_i1:720-1061(+)